MTKIRAKQIYADTLPQQAHDVASKEYVDSVLNGIASSGETSSLSSVEQRKLAYFHAMGVAMTNKNQLLYEATYKSSHNVRLGEVWSDSIAYALDYDSAVAEASSNPAVTLHQEVLLTPIPMSSGQTYALLSGSTMVKPWISPVDVPNAASNEPSYGYRVRLFRGADAVSGATNSEILMSEGSWVVDYYAGLIHFSDDGVDFTPVGMGWGSIKATVFQYTGNFGVSNKADSVIPSSNFEMNALSVITDNAQACATGLLSIPVSGSSIVVFVNGISVSVGDGDKTKSCYFSGDDGITARSLGSLAFGDLLYWNSSIAGYNLDAATDKISFVYLSKL